MGLSWNCQAGEPGRRHPDCTGCGCECHATRPPSNFREIFEAGRAARQPATDTAPDNDPPPAREEQEELPL